jgi:hypothetical protein
MANAAPLTVIAAKVQPIRRRLIRKSRSFAFTRYECRFYDTTAPTKEGLLRDDKIVSNLHYKISGRGFHQMFGTCDLPTRAFRF